MTRKPPLTCCCPQQQQVSGGGFHTQEIVLWNRSMQFKRRFLYGTWISIYDFYRLENHRENCPLILSSESNCPGIICDDDWSSAKSFALPSSFFWKTRIGCTLFSMRRSVSFMHMSMYLKKKSEVRRALKRSLRSKSSTLGTCKNEVLIPTELLRSQN